jgi:hypothetical protein
MNNYRSHQVIKHTIIQQCVPNANQCSYVGQTQQCGGAMESNLQQLIVFMEEQNK